MRGWGGGGGGVGMVGFQGGGGGGGEGRFDTNLQYHMVKHGKNMCILCEELQPSGKGEGLG